jgi:hypothetical protein
VTSQHLERAKAERMTRKSFADLCHHAKNIVTI